MPLQNRIDADRLRELWGSLPPGMTTAQIAERLGISKSGMWVARRRLGLKDREPVSWNRGACKSIDVPLLFRLWHTDAAKMPIGEIAKRLGITLTTLYKHARKHHLPKRPRANAADRDRDDEEFCPTPEEIAERAAYCRMMRERGTPIGGAA